MIFMCNGNDMLIVKRLLAKKIIRQCVYVYEHGTKFPNSEIQSYQFEHEKDKQYAFLRKMNGDVIVLLSWNYKLPLKVIESYQCFNVHPSLLPKYRGPLPLVFQILNGEKEGGVTLHKVDEEYDTGDICIQQAFSINSSDTFVRLYKKIFKTIGVILEEFIRNYPNLSYKKQESFNASYYSLQDLNAYIINADITYERLNTIVRAFDNKIPIKIILNEQVHILKEYSQTKENDNYVPYMLRDRLIYICVDK